jgi:hypothetical protein
MVDSLAGRLHGMMSQPRILVSIEIFAAALPQRSRNGRHVLCVHELNS